jgi:phytoene dehydrogenase-like protein
MSEQYDVVIAGAGHNSLICGAYLAKAGLRVLALEARDMIGGNTVSEELTIPGFLHDSCSSAHALFQASPTIRDNELELDRYGLSYLRPDPVVTMPFEDGSRLTQWLDIDRTVEEFAKFSKRDGEAYRRMMAEYDSVKRFSTAIPIHLLVTGLTSTLLSWSAQTAHSGCGAIASRRWKSSTTILRTTTAVPSCYGWRS